MVHHLRLVLLSLSALLLVILSVLLLLVTVGVLMMILLVLVLVGMVVSMALNGVERELVLGAVVRRVEAVSVPVVDIIAGIVEASVRCREATRERLMLETARVWREGRRAHREALVVVVVVHCAAGASGSDELVRKWLARFAHLASCSVG